MNVKEGERSENAHKRHAAHDQRQSKAKRSHFHWALYRGPRSISMACFIICFIFFFSLFLSLFSLTRFSVVLHINHEQGHTHTHTHAAQRQFAIPNGSSCSQQFNIALTCFDTLRKRKEKNWLDLTWKVVFARFVSHSHARCHCRLIGLITFQSALFDVSCRSARICEFFPRKKKWLFEKRRRRSRKKRDLSQMRTISLSTHWKCRISF